MVFCFPMSAGRGASNGDLKFENKKRLSKSNIDSLARGCCKESTTNEKDRRLNGFKTGHNGCSELAVFECYLKDFTIYLMLIYSKC